MPSIFNDNLFDDFFDFPFYDDKADRKIQRKLYGHHAGNLMKTDIKEKKDGYELEIDLPGFKKDEVTAELNDGQSALPKDWIRMSRRKKLVSTSVVNVMQEPAREVIM